MSYSLPSGFTIRNHPNVILEIHINERGINDNIMKILYSCGLFAFGYDINKQLFWGKKMKNSLLQFHFILKINSGNSVINMTNIELYVIHDDKCNTNTKSISRILTNMFNQI